MKIRVDYKSIDNKVLPNVDKSIENINATFNNVGTMNIPNDFMYAKNIGNIKSDLESIKSRLNSKREKISNTSKKYSKRQSLNTENIKEIKIDKLSYRKSNNT